MLKILNFNFIVSKINQNKDEDIKILNLSTWKFKIWEYKNLKCSFVKKI